LLEHRVTDVEADFFSCLIDCGIRHWRSFSSNGPRRNGLNFDRFWCRLFSRSFGFNRERVVPLRGEIDLCWTRGFGWS
jgi:hypothetical protein